MNDPYMAMAGVGGSPNQMDVGMAGVLEGAPMFGGMSAMGGHMQPMFQGLNQQAGVFQGPYSPMYPPQFSNPQFPQHQQIQPVNLPMRPFEFPQREEIQPVNLPLKKPMY